MTLRLSGWGALAVLASVAGLGVTSTGCGGADPEVASAQSVESTESAYSTGMIAGPVKWHPGHYATVMTYQTKVPGYFDELYKELEATPAIRGIQIRFLWSELEDDVGNFTFGAIDQYLSNLQARGKRLVIQVQTRSFGTDWKLIPEYLKKDAAYEGGQFAYRRDGVVHGHNVKFWNKAVRMRLARLFKALGERYDGKAFVEGIGMIETAVGDAVPLQTEAQMDAYYENLLIANQALREAFPTTVTFQEVNFPFKRVGRIVEGLKNRGVGLSSPDAFIHEPKLLDGVFAQYPKLSGLVPLGPQVMQTSYRQTTAAGGREPKVDELVAFTRDKLKANYVFWTRDVGWKDETAYYPKVLAHLASFPAGPGGLDARCPAAFLACNRN